MQCKNPQVFNCSAIQIRKDYPPPGQAIYLFSAGSHLLSSPNKDRKTLQIYKRMHKPFRCD